MKILVVEDEKHLAEGLRFNLEEENYEVETIDNGETALEILADENTNFDAVVLDVMLPGADGFAVAQAMREQGNYTPILMLTALNRPEDVLQGFEAGADDYLPKPFELNIFLARLNGLLRRRRWLSEEEKIKTSGDFLEINGRTIDLVNLELRNGDEKIQLTLMEVNLLKFLFDNAGRAVSRKRILEEVWDLHEDTDTRAIDNFIVRLRKYLEDTPEKPRILQTVRGVGYRFLKEEEKKRRKGKEGKK